MIAQRWLTATVWWGTAGVLNPVTGWAVAALFGPLTGTRRRAALAAIVLAAGGWLAAAAGILFFPAIAALWRGIAGSPEAFDVAWLRLSLTAAVAALPALAGLLALTVATADARPQGRTLLRAVVLGYPLTVGLALTLPLLAVFLPLLLLRDRWRGWSAQTLPAAARDTALLVRTVHNGLHDAGWLVTATPPSALLRLPQAIASLFGRGSLGGLLPGQRPALRGSDLEVMFYPAALVVRGSGRSRTQARAVIADALAFSDARLTWTAAGGRIEERLAALRQTPARAESNGSGLALAELARVRHEARQAALPVEEWETVERLCVRAERDLLLAAVGAGPVMLTAAPVTVVPAGGAPTAAVTQPPENALSLPMFPALPVPAGEVTVAPITASVPSSGISPAALAATLAAAAVVFWRITADPAQAEA